tara:strand:+ start:251 stop:571 length:321 start_codon:yes stop_codon:yes gene_type:complete
MDHLVERLLTSQPIEFESRTSSLEELKERLLDIKFVFVTFPETKGGTEIGIDVDTGLTDIKSADFIKGTGNIRVVGTCELNYQKVRCIAEIDLSTKKGTGCLELLK